jgi:hypothetical protein
MLPPRRLNSTRLLAFFFLLATPAFGLAAPAPQPDGPALDPYQLLSNPSMETYDPPYGEYQGVPCQVASGWQRYWTDCAEPYWMDGWVFANSHLGNGWLDCIQGATCQFLFATEPYAAGLRQSVAVTPGVGYGFHAAMLTIFQTSAQPQHHNTMFKKVGIDPTGGTDPQSAAVVWSESDGWDQGPWRVDLRAAVYAEAPTMTVFIQVDSPYPSGHPSLLNLSFLDSAILAQTPTIHATSPATSDVPDLTVSWDNAVPAPGGELRWRDVQWLDEAEGVWHDWLTRTYAVGATFHGRYGHAYRFRARVWQLYENGAHLYSPYRAAGDTRTWVPGSRLVGRVLSHDGRAVGSARVSVPGTPYSTFSAGDGGYELGMPPWSAPEVIAVTHPSYLAPPGLYGVTLGLTDTVPFTWTLRPADDAIANGQLEETLDGWQTLGLEPHIVADPVHTGHGAAALADPAGGPFSSGIAQSVILEPTWEPALSFWYNAAGAQHDDLFRVTYSLVDPTLPLTFTWVVTPALAAPGWVHVTLPAGPPDRYAQGTATVRLQFWHEFGGRSPAALYLDEISLGATPGGPYRAHLPLISRRHR